MTPSPHNQQLESLKRFRTLLIVTAIFYPLGSLTGQRIFPADYNPLWPRLILSAVAFLLVGLSFKSAWVQKRLNFLFHSFLITVMGHYWFLIIKNREDPIFSLGLFAVIPFISACVSSRRFFIALSVLNLLVGMPILIMSIGQDTPTVYMPLGLGSILLVTYLSLHSRLKAMEVLHSNQVRTDMILSQIPAILWTTDTQLIGTSSAGTGLAKLKSVPNRVVGTDFNMYDRDKNPSHPAPSLHHRALQGESGSETAEWNGRNYQIHVQPLKNPDGTIEGCIGLALDVTERIQMEKDLLDTQQQLMQSQKLESVGQLASGIAHDYNNILMVIRSLTTSLLDEFPSTPEAQSKIAAILNAAKRGEEVTQRLLGFARGGTSLRHPVDLRDSIEEVKAILGQSVDKTITIRSSAPETLLDIEANSTEVLQVLMNLGVNARDAMPNGGELSFEAENIIVDYNHPQRGLLTLTPGKYVRLKVKDSGAGIPKDVQNKIFDPFFTTKDIGKGTGLGLSVVYGIMKAQQGSVSVESEPGKGSTFFLYFRALENGSAANEKEQGQAPEKGSGASIQGLHILLADDEPLIRKLVCRRLERAGAQVYTVDDGEKAVQLFLDHRDKIHLLILDVGMPVLNGIQAFTKIRKINPDVPAIFSTGYGEDEHIKAALKEHNVDAIHKPYDIDQLIQKASFMSKSSHYQKAS